MGTHKGGDAVFSLGSQGILEVVVMVCLVTQQMAHVAGAWGQTCPPSNIQGLCCELVLPLGELLVQ